MHTTLHPCVAGELNIEGEECVRRCRGSTRGVSFKGIGSVCDRQNFCSYFDSCSCCDDQAFPRWVSGASGSSSPCAPCCDLGSLIFRDACDYLSGFSPCDCDAHQSGHRLLAAVRCLVCPGSPSSLRLACPRCGKAQCRESSVHYDFPPALARAQPLFFSLRGASAGCRPRAPALRAGDSRARAGRGSCSSPKMLSSLNVSLARLVSSPDPAGAPSSSLSPPRPQFQAALKVASLSTVSQPRISPWRCPPARSPKWMLLLLTSMSMRKGEANRLIELLWELPTTRRILCLPWTSSQNVSREGMPMRHFADIYTTITLLILVLQKKKEKNCSFETSTLHPYVVFASVMSSEAGIYDCLGLHSLQSRFLASSGSTKSNIRAFLSSHKWRRS